MLQAATSHDVAAFFASGPRPSAPGPASRGPARQTPGPLRARPPTIRPMDQKRRVRVSKYLARHLRHQPERLGIVLDPADPADVRDLKHDLVRRIEEYRAGWKAIEAMGAVLKDARMGLLDFYGTVEGKLVWLCWKYGESEVAHYHAL